MNLQPISDKGRQTIIKAGGNPADFAGYDPETSSFVSHAELRSVQDKSSALAPSNPYMAAIAEPVLRTGADIYRAGRRFPQAAAEMVFGKQADSAISAAGATPITAINFLAEQALSRGARGAAQFRQPGAADTALSTAAGLTSAITPYFVNPMLGLTTSAMQGAGAGSEKAETMGATPGQELANMTMRAGASAALDKIGMLGAAKTPMAWAPMAKLAARGALEGAATQGSFNVADKITFNPNQDLSEGVMTSALVGAAAPVALRGAGEGIERLQGSRPPVMQTRSPRSVLEEGARLGYDKRQAFVDQINKQYPNLFEGGLTIERLGGAEGNRMSDDSIRAIIDLASRAGEAPPLSSPHQQLVAQLARSGLIDPTNIAEARRVLNEGPTAFADIQARGAGLLAASRANEVTAAQRAAEAAARGDVSGSVKIAAEMDAARQADRAKLEVQQGAARTEARAAADAETALRAEYELPANYMFKAIDTKGKIAEARAYDKARASGIKSAVTGDTLYAPESDLGRMQEPSLRSINPPERPMSAEQTLLAEREVAEAERLKAAAVPQAAQQGAQAAAQTAATGVPAPETIVTGAAAKAPTPVPTAEHPVVTQNASKNVAPQGKLKEGTDIPNPQGKGLGATDSTSEPGTGTPDLAAKSAPAPASVPLKPSSDPSSSRLEPVVPPVAEGVSKNPSAAAVVEAAGTKEATPVSAPPMTSALPLNDQIRASYTRALEEGRTKDVNELAKLLRQRGVPVPDNAGAAPPVVETPRPLTSAVDASALPPALRELGVEAQDVNTRALRLEMEGKTAEADALRAQFAAKRRAAEATGFTSIPKSEVASPVATVKAEPAKSEQTVSAQPKLTDVEKAQLQTEMGGKKPRAEKSAAPAPLKIKQQTADPVAADRALLDQVGLVVRKKPDGTYELYNKQIDEVVRQLGGAADEAEAIGAAARSVRESNKPGGLGSKMRPSTGEEGFVAVPEFVESAGKAVGSAVRSGLSRIRSATQQLADYGARAGDETAKYGARRLNETATVAAVDAQKIINENQRTWNALSAKEREELTDILQYERAQRIAYAGRMSPRVKNAYFETRGLLRELGERAAREGPRIQEGKEWRPLIVDEFWAPESLSGKIIKQLQDTSIDKATGRTVRDGLIEEVRNWWRQNGMSEDQINTEIKRFDIESRTGDADIEFDALHRPMTLPLPPGWAGNTQDAINRYAQKYAFEMARHKYIDQDELLGPMSRGQRQSLDNLGRLTARPFEAGEVGETTESMFRAALNSFALQLNPGRQTAAQRLSNVANPLAVQTGATVRDAVNMMGTLVDDAGVKNAFKGLFEGVSKYRDLKARGLVRDTGNLSGDWQRVGEAFENGQVLETIRDAVRLANRGTGVDALNKLMQAVSSAAGIARAKEAMVKGDEAFFRRVGIPEWRAKTPAEVEDYVARWVVEGSQGSMGAKDQPTHMLKSSGFGAQFMPIMRWSFAFSNQQIDRAIKPLLDANLSPAQRVKPMFTRLVGAAAATTVANTLLQTIFGRDDRNITFKEWQAAGYPNKLKYAAQKLTDLQVLPIVTAAANVLTGGQQMPRNLGVEIIPNVVNQVAALAETKREFTQEDYMKAVDAIVDRAVSNWRDVSKVVGGETKDPIEQARARYENMNTAVRPAAMANPLNLTAQFNDAKTAPEALAIARRIVDTATLDTPDVSVRGPSQDAAFDKWLEKTNPELSRQYRLDNMTKAQGLDTVYNTKRALAKAVNAALEKKRALLMSKEPNEVKRAQGVKIDWESGGYRMK